MSKREWIGAFIIAGLWMGGKHLLSGGNPYEANSATASAQTAAAQSTSNRAWQADYGPYSEGTWQLSDWVSEGNCDRTQPFARYVDGTEVDCTDATSCFDGAKPDINRSANGGYTVASSEGFGVTLPLTKIDDNTVAKGPISHLDRTKLAQRNGRFDQTAFLQQFRKKLVFIKCKL